MDQSQSLQAQSDDKESRDTTAISALVNEGELQDVLRLCSAMVNTVKLLRVDLDRLLAVINCSPPNTTLAWLRGYQKPGTFCNRQQAHSHSFLETVQRHPHRHKPLRATWSQCSQTFSSREQMYLVTATHRNQRSTWTNNTHALLCQMVSRFSATTGRGGSFQEYKKLQSLQNQHR